MTWRRAAAALLLAPLLSAAALLGGLEVFGQLRHLAFPYLWLFLILELLIERYRLNDAQVFLAGAVFSFLYSGLYTKAMHDGLALTGLDWVAVLGGPLEWGMFCVLWFHLLAAVSPRSEGSSGPLWPSLLFIAPLTLWAVGVYLLKTVLGHYQAENALDPFYLFSDALLLAMAWLVLKRLQTLPAAGAAGAKNSPWIWLWVGLGLWLLGSGLLAQVCEGLPRALLLMVQALWGAGWGIFLWTSWRDRSAYDDTPVRRSRPVLAAAALRVLGTIVLLKLFGPGSEDPRTALWSGVLCDLPSKVLFYYAFLTSRLDV
ncbi:MAG: hypothetical protein AAB320_03395 [Elusimicrobiota bacterium]|mgnify:CR=1 FL=1